MKRDFLILKYVIRKVSFIGIMLFLSGTILYAQERMLYSQNVDTPFDVNEIIERVSDKKMDSNRFKSGEFLIDTSITYVWAGGNQYSPAVAFDGTNYLVVWQDHRSGSHDIYGCRISPSGTPLDPDAFVISAAVSGQYSPAVAFDGTNYFVVWEDDRDADVDLYGARVNPQGIVLDTQGIAIHTGAGQQRSPSIVFGGTNYLVVWQNGYITSGFDIYACRVSQSGAVLDPGGIVISASPYTEEFPSVAFDGTNYFIVWDDYRGDPYYDIYGCRVTQSGAVLDPGGIAISTATDHQINPSIAFDGTNYLVVWYDDRSPSGVYGTRVAQSGAVLDPSGFAIATGGYPRCIGFDGTNYLVVWECNDPFCDIYGTRVSQSGTVLDPVGFVISTATNTQNFSSVAFDGTNYFVVWQDGRNGGNTDIYGCRVATSGTLLDPDGLLISAAVNSQDLSSIAFDGTNYLVVWQDNRNGSWDIYGARVTQSGAVLDPDGIAISTATGSRMYPSIAFDGTNYLVVWQGFYGASSYDIYGSRVSPAGTVLDPAGIAISTASETQWFPSIAFDGTNYLVVWHDNRALVSYDIYGTRVSPAGTVLDPTGIPISTTAGDQWYSSVAFDGINYLVVWQDNRNGSWDIYGARVTQSGAVLDPDGIAISTGGNSQRYPSITFDGMKYLVVWEEMRTDIDIYGAWMNTFGSVISYLHLPVSTQSGNQRKPALTKGIDGQILATYSGWTDYINSHPANAIRIWGKLYQPPDISTNPPELIFDYTTTIGLKGYTYMPCPSEIRNPTFPLINPSLSEKIKNSSEEELIPILILMSENLNSDVLAKQARDLSKQKRRVSVSNQLKSFATETQKSVFSYLKSEEQRGKAKDLHSLWVVNSISAKVTKDVIGKLSNMRGIYHILYDWDCIRALGVAAPSDQTEIYAKSTTYSGKSSKAIVWGVEKIGAPQVWSELGYTGEGVVIGHLDTGVNYNHSDLADHMWQGAPNHGINFAYGTDDPIDDEGHGTRTAGTIAGDGTSGTQTGVAPDAQIMAIKVLNSEGRGTLSSLVSGVQYAIDNGADVINMSLGADSADNWTKDYLRDMCNNVYAVDVPMSIAAGNGDGIGGHYSVPYDIASPADVPAPWYGSAGHSASLAVGATDAGDNIASFSSYGPTEWNTTNWTDYPYPPGLMKPDVSAPGVNIVSLSYDNNTGYTSGMDGTSYACPHVTGTIALMLEKNILLTSVEIDSILEVTSIDLGAVGRDNHYGAGRINAYDAVDAVEKSNVEKGTFFIVNATTGGDLYCTDITWSAPWIKSVSPTAPFILSGESTEVRVYVDTVGLSLTPGIYTDILWIYSNDPDENPYPEHITLIIGDYLAGSPYITTAEKLGNNLKFTWQTLTGADHYVVYRNTNPSFTPTHADSIGWTTDTFYTDVGVINSPSSYYYLVKGATAGGAKSAKSNMAYKFNKFFNENPGATSDKNWTSLPWYSEYATVSDLTADLSASGDPLTGLTNLRNDQLFESWLYNPIFGWIGTDFSIVPGRGYEVVTTKDTSLVLVGANNPDGLVVLNENPDASDKNWVSIPYNAAYNTVSDITAEYSASGDPLTGLTNLRDDQLFESWLYNPIFGWIGTDFSIVPGRGYELIVITDTTWDPTEYTNEATQALVKQTKDKDIEVFCGHLTEPTRAPAWVIRDEPISEQSDPAGSRTPTGKKSIHLNTDIDFYEPISRHKLTDVSKAKSLRESGISHNVFAHLAPDDLNNIVFTAYRMDNPADVLTEQLIGCGVVTKDAQTGIWFNTGNFKKPWQDEEEVMLIIEATKKGKTYFNVVSFNLDKDVDLQNLGKIALSPFPEPRLEQDAVSWQGIDNDHIIGYSLYHDDKRLNEKVITANHYAAAGDVNVRPVIKGGYETVYANSQEQVQQESDNKHLPLAFSFGVYPSPFTSRTRIDYALPRVSVVDVVVYDVTGKRVKTLVSERLDPGYYQTTWQGNDEHGRKVSAGVYFILMNTNDYASQRKVIFVH